MDERRSRDAAITGVARGALGTGTALDDTQEWVIPEGLEATATVVPTTAGASLAQEPGPPAPVAPAPLTPAPLTPEAVAPEPVTREPVTRRRRAAITGGGFSPGPRTAGVAAVVLLALVGVAAAVTTFDRGNPGAATPAEAPASVAPTDAPAAEADGKGGGKKDKDNGKDKGHGNGNGNGGGRGSD